MARGTLTGTLVIDPSAAGETDDESDAPLTVEEELLQKIGSRLRQGFPRAAQAAAVDLVNTIAARHDIGGGAWL